MEADTKDNAMFIKNIVHHTSYLEKLIELNTHTIEMMTQMLDSLKLEAAYSTLTNSKIDEKAQAMFR